MRIFSLLGIVRKYYIIDDEGLSKDMGIGMIECGHGHEMEKERPVNVYLCCLCKRAKTTQKDYKLYKTCLFS
jgi:hypothetical protein